VPTLQQVQNAFTHAITAYECDTAHADAIGQGDLLPITVLAIDQLLPPPGNDPPVEKMYACGLTQNQDLIWAANQVQRATIVPQECVVDINVQQPVAAPSADPYRPLITAESEADVDLTPQTQNPTTDNNDFLWDVYKLLLLPSPVRLLTSRSPHYAHAHVAGVLADLIAAYSDQIFSPTGSSEIWIVQLPTATLSNSTGRITAWQVTHGQPAVLLQAPLVWTPLP